MPPFFSSPNDDFKVKCYVPKLNYKAYIHYMWNYILLWLSALNYRNQDRIDLLLYPFLAPSQKLFLKGLPGTVVYIHVSIYLCNYDFKPIFDKAAGTFELFLKGGLLRLNEVQNNRIRVSLRGPLLWYDMFVLHQYSTAMPIIWKCRSQEGLFAMTKMPPFTPDFFE